MITTIAAIVKSSTKYKMVPIIPNDKKMMLITNPAVPKPLPVLPFPNVLAFLPLLTAIAPKMIEIRYMTKKNQSATNVMIKKVAGKI